MVDDVVGTGFVLACTEDPRVALEQDQQAFLDRIAAHVLHLVAPSDPADPAAGVNDDRAVDIDGSCLRHLASAGHAVMLIRPEHDLFGAAARMSDLPALIGDLQRQLLDRQPSSASPAKARTDPSTAPAAATA